MAAGEVGSHGARAVALVAPVSGVGIVPVTARGRPRTDKRHIKVSQDRYMNIPICAYFQKVNHKVKYIIA